MFRNLTYRQKLRLVGLAALLSLFICYRLSISRTIEEYHKYEQAAVDPASSDGPGASPAALEGRTAAVEGIISLYQLDSLQPDKDLLTATSDYCKSNNLQLKEYKPYGLSRTDSLPVLTRVVTVSGSFIPCLKFLYSVERLHQLGRVSAAEFKSYKDPQDKKLKLDCTVYIQNLIESDHEQ